MTEEGRKLVKDPEAQAIAKIIEMLEALGDGLNGSRIRRRVLRYILDRFHDDVEDED